MLQITLIITLIMKKLLVFYNPLIPPNMKTTRISISISILGMVIFLLFPSLISAQPGPRGQERKERIEAQKIAFITDKLQLTPAEAQVFWPLYNEQDAKRDEILGKLRTRNRGFMEADPNEMSEDEALKLADAQIVEEQMLLDLRKEYHAKYKKVLPATKILKLYQAEREFRRVLLEKIRGPHKPR